MPVDLFIFGLSVEYLQVADDKFTKWVQGLEGYLRSVAPDEVIVHYSARPIAAPWIGHPFLLVGRSEEVDAYFDALSVQSRRIYSDCAYFWILSDNEQAGRRCSDLPRNRIINLISMSNDYTVVWAQLEELVEHPDIIGLGHALHVIRSEISRIANGTNGPGSPALILGETGSGKSSIARALHAVERCHRLNISSEEKFKGQSAALPKDETRRREEDKIREVACGYFTEHILQDQLFGHYKGAYTGADKDKEGLLARYRDGTIVLHDFDVAPSVQAPLLSVLDTPKGESAKITRLGGEEEEPDQSRVWLIFTTNADVGSLVVQNKLREDFLFRFEHRVIFVPPLRERPADLPAIARHIWLQCWEENDTRRRGLSPPVLEWLVQQKTQWRGNIRSLRALLSLAASMAKLPAHRGRTAQSLLTEIMSRGPEYPDWIRILATKNFADSAFQRESAFSSSVQQLPLNAETETREGVIKDRCGSVALPVADKDVIFHGREVNKESESAHLERPSVANLTPALLEELKNAFSPKWSWLSEKEDEERIATILRERWALDRDHNRLDQMFQWLDDRKKRREPDNPRSIHLHKLLLFLLLREDHAGHGKQFRSILDLKPTQTDKVVKQLVTFGLVVQDGRDKDGVRFTLAKDPGP